MRRLDEVGGVMGEKTCPLSSTVPAGYGICPCDRAKCAWWVASEDGSEGCVAVKLLDELVELRRVLRRELGR